VPSRGVFHFVFSDQRRQLSGMKIVTIIARILLGLAFVVFGLNGFLHFIPGPPPPPDSPAGQFFAAVTTSGFIKPIFALQFIGGLLVLLGIFVPLGLTILAPIIVNILLFPHLHGSRSERNDAWHHRHCARGFSNLALLGELPRPGATLRRV
jgi:uncharacterized membrane protein YphA (DoxX/SURF4 family)